MDSSAIQRAAELLERARRTGQLLAGFDELLRPATIAEAQTIQDALIERIGEAVPAWKIAGISEDTLSRGAIIASRMYQSPARIDPATVPLLGIEGEIAYRVDRALPPRKEEYTIAEVEAAVTALPTIEIVDSRFANYKAIPVIHRVADFMSNGALVCGEARADWRKFDFTTIPVKLWIGDRLIVNSKGGHNAGNPILPLVTLANSWRLTRGVPAGPIFTTGALTGLHRAKPGDTIVTEFEGFGRVEMQFKK